MTLVPHPLGLKVTGEIDYANRHVLAGALDQALQTGKQDLRLDLSGLTFIDVAGMRVIVAGAGRLPQGRRLILAPVSPQARRLLTLTGWRHASGLHMP
ncbi:STAS domain-containing protein [Nonomuraea solani]|uniref:STAS domain-containing protein n=1 Tax=Nonomuraea solani TaxID=1144553 RepID=UPI00135B3EA0|nr:STAS domain-containing protein [Nonomuraea solani]